MALARAQELDSYFESTGKVMGPLHGLPISLKDQFRIKVRSRLEVFFEWRLLTDG
jgi:amidase